MENLPTYRLTQSGPEAQEILDQVNLNTVDIEQLKRLYQALTQSEPEIIEPNDTWPVANPEENVIYRVIDRVNTPPQYYTDYMWNGTSMVPMAQYDNAIDNEPTANSNNLVKSGGVYSFVHANGGAYDISAAHAVGGVLATYDDLEDALGTNGANVPAAVRKGGMSIKFVLSSDNKYKQARFMRSTFNASQFGDVRFWQGIEDELVAGSENLVNSGGIIDANKNLNWTNSRFSEHFPINFRGTSAIAYYPIRFVRGTTYTFVMTSGTDSQVALELYDSTKTKITGKFPYGASSFIINTTSKQWTCNTDDVYYILLYAATGNAVVSIDASNNLITPEDLSCLVAPDTIPTEGNLNVITSGGVFDYTESSVRNSFLFNDSFPVTFNIPKTGGHFIPFRMIKGVVYTITSTGNAGGLYIYNKNKEQISSKFPAGASSIALPTSSPVTWTCNTDDVYYLYTYGASGGINVTINATGLVTSEEMKALSKIDAYPKNESTGLLESGGAYNSTQDAVGAVAKDAEYLPIKIDGEIGSVRLVPFRFKKGVLYTFKNNLENDSTAIYIYDKDKQRIERKFPSGVTTFLATPEGNTWLCNLDYVYYVGVYTTVQAEVTIDVGTGFVEDEIYVGNGIAQASCHAGNNQKNLLLSVITDLHGNELNFKRYMGICNYFTTYISGMLCMGDNVADKYSDDFTFVDKYINGEKVMWVVGNHDGNDGTGDWQGAGAVNVYNKFIKPYVANWGVVQPSNAEANGYNYYYKDFISYGIRLIALDSIFADGTQASWLESVLEDARQNNLAVICTQHYPAGLLTKHQNTFSSLLQTPTSGSLGYSSFISKVSDFIDNGGEFVTWLCGHWHADINGVLTADTRQSMFMFSCDSVYGAEDDMSYVGAQCITMVGVDKQKKLIKLFRIGDDIDLDMRSKRLLCYNYETKQLISNW